MEEGASLVLVSGVTGGKLAGVVALAIDEGEWIRETPWRRTISGRRCSDGYVLGRERGAGPSSEGRVRVMLSAQFVYKVATAIQSEHLVVVCTES